MFVVYPSEAGGLTRATRIGALAAAPASGACRQLGRTRRRDRRQRSPRRSIVNFPFASDTHYPLQVGDVLDEPVAIENGRIALGSEPGLGVYARPRGRRELSALELRESPFYDDIRGEAPGVGQIL